MKQVHLTIIWSGTPYGAWTATPLRLGQKLPTEALIDVLSSFLNPHQPNQPRPPNAKAP